MEVDLPELRLEPATVLSIDELADLFTRGYEGYFVPMSLDRAAMQLFVDAFDVDLARSRVAFLDGKPVGIANLAVRGDRAWIAGIGVVPSARRHGVGLALMEAILADAPGTVTLEVLEQNEPAIALYRRLGFETSRILEVWSLDAEVPAVELEEVAAEPLGQDDLPWQRADDSLPPDAIRLEADGGAVLCRAAGPVVSVLQLRARDVDTAELLLRAARSRGEGLRFVNVPEGDLASEALATLGGVVQLRQLEMVLQN